MATLPIHNNLREVSIADIETHWTAVEKKVHRKPVTLTYHGEPKAVLISTTEYNKIMQVLIELQEDAEDLEAVAQHKPEESIPFGVVVENLKRDGKL